MSERMRHSLDFVAGSSNNQTAVIVLNQKLPKQTQLLWNTARVHICADGGANRLYYGTGSLAERLIPDYIIGDLDSVQPFVRDFYLSKGTKILDKSDDQDTTDLQKCLAFIRDAMPQHKILVLGALGGRFDHEMGNLNALHLFRDLRITLLDDQNIVFLLPGGYLHQLEAVPGAHCGLIPLGTPSTRTTTTGLCWNLDATPIAFGSLVSTSNVVENETVTVSSDVDLLWTMEIKQS